MKWNIQHENIYNCDDASQSDEITENVSFKEKEELRNNDNLIGSNSKNLDNLICTIRIDKNIEGVKEEYC